MKKFLDILWHGLLICLFGYFVFCLFDCTDTSPVKSIESAKPQVVPDSHYCKTIAALPETKRAVGVRGKYWQNGQTLRIKLLGGTAQQRAYFINAMLEWQKHVNLNISYVTTGVSDIRVGFVSGSGSWSYCGTEAKSIPQDQPTINIGWSGSPVNLHEIAHMIGGLHEQSSPNSDIQWNKPVVYAALGGSPNFWDAATVDWNVFRKLTPAEAEATTYDPNSILQYSVPASWTYNYPNGIPGGDKLSPQDISFWSAKYPKPAPPPPAPTTVTIPKYQRDSIPKWMTAAK